MSAVATLQRVPRWAAQKPTGASVATAIFFLLLYSLPFAALVRDWLNDADAGHGLLLVPLAMIICYRRGLVSEPRQQMVLGTLIVALAVMLTYIAQLAAELFVLRASMVLALAGLVICAFGVAQIKRWLMPAMLVILSIPLPAVVLATIALPLQLRASEIGAAMLRWRHVPVLLDGNIIRLPGHTLFVTEACSGLRSLSALLALGLLMGSMALVTPIGRIAILLLSVPVAIVVNGIRVFLTGFLVFFVSPNAGKGFMHVTEGWLLFIVAFGALGVLTMLAARTEQWIQATRARRAAAS